MNKVICKVENPELRALISKEIKIASPQRLQRAAELRIQAKEMLQQAEDLVSSAQQIVDCDANNSHEFECDPHSMGEYFETCIHCGWIHTV